MNPRYLLPVLFILLTIAGCQKDKSSSPAPNTNPTITTTTTTTTTVTPVVTPTITPKTVLPYTDTFYGQLTEGDWAYSNSYWAAVNLRVFVYHDAHNQVIISSDNFRSLVFLDSINLGGNFTVNATNTYSYTNLSYDGWGFADSVILGANTLVYYYSHSMCPDDDEVYFSGTKQTK
jgi:hypothetical protein